MNKITINGLTTSVTGRNIQVKDIKNSKVSISVDGVLITETDSREVIIKFEGNLASLNATNANVYGNVDGKVDATNVKIGGTVWGDVNATNVTVGHIIGNVDATNVRHK